MSLLAPFFFQQLLNNGSLNSNNSHYFIFIQVIFNVICHKLKNIFVPSAFHGFFFILKAIERLRNCLKLMDSSIFISDAISVELLIATDLCVYSSEYINIIYL